MEAYRVIADQQLNEILQSMMCYCDSNRMSGMPELLQQIGEIQEEDEDRPVTNTRAIELNIDARESNEVDLRAVAQ